MVPGNILEDRNQKKKKGKEELVLLKSKQSEFYNIAIKFSYENCLNLETRESENCSVSHLRRM